MKSKGLVICLFMISLRVLAQNHSDQTPFSVQHALDQLPPVFMKNLGQWNDQVYYKTSIAGADVSFMKNQVSFAFQRPVKDIKTADGLIDNYNFQPVSSNNELLVWNQKFENANPSAQLIADQMHEGKTNFLLGDDSSHWKSNVPEYGLLSYRNIYHQIDLRYYTNKNSLKYDYIIHPGGEVSHIKMNCEGVLNLQVNNNNELEIETAWGILKEKRPFSYQFINGRKEEVDVRFIVISNGIYGFKIFSSYNPAIDLIIDPVILEWSTFVGGAGNGNGYIFDFAADSSGFIYATGYYNENFPVTPGVYDTSYNQGGSCGFGGAFEDIYVIKLNPDATAIEWATYIGGSCAERGRGIAINDAGESFITGWTKSVDFPKVNPVQASLNGSTDVIALRLNATGSGLIYSGCFGGNYNDWGEKIAINSVNEAYMTGATLDNNSAPGFPVTGNSFQPVYGGGAYQSDAYVTKLSPTGNLIFSSFLGGPLWDWGYGIDVNQAGEAFVTGKGQTGFPATAGAFQTSVGAGDHVFITRIDPAGLFMIYSTMVGGAMTTNGSCACESGNFIRINNYDEAFVAGNVRSSDFPVSSGAYDTTYNNGYYGDAFILKLNNTGSNLVYSTYLGGSSLDIAWGLDLDSAGNAFVAGYTDGVDFPVTTCAYDSSYNGSIDGDFFISKLSSNGSELMYSSFVGGDEQDYWEPKVIVNGSMCDQRIIFSGTTHSQNFPTTNGVIQPVKLNGVNDQPCIFKMKPVIYPGFISPDSAACSTTVVFTDTTSSCGLWDNAFTTHHWEFGDGTSADGISVSHTFSTSGTFYVRLTVGCPVDSISKPIIITCSNLPVVSFISSDTAFCEKQCLDFYDLSTNNPTSWQWFFPGADSLTSSQQNPSNICYSAYGSFDVTLVACNNFGCDTLHLVNFIKEFQSPPVPVITVNTDTLFSTPAYSYQWYNSNGIIPGAVNSYFVFQQPGNYYVVVTDTNGCASSSALFYSGVNEMPADGNAVLIKPNPNDGNFEILIPSFTGKTVHCQIFDLTGRCIYNSVFQENKSENKISLVEPANGIYFLRLESENIIWNRKILIVR